MRALSIEKGSTTERRSSISGRSEPGEFYPGFGGLRAAT
jgi:hypothetical protein